MADGISKVEGWCKFLQLLLIITSVVLLWVLDRWTPVFLTEVQANFAYAVDGVSLFLVLIQLSGNISKKPIPKLVVILLAITGTIFWTTAAVIELRSYSYSFPEDDDFLPIGLLIQIEEYRKIFLSLGIITAINAFSLLVEAIGVSSWRNSASAAQRGFVFQTV